MSFRYFITFALFIIAINTHATHFLAGQITYSRYLLTNKYEIKAIIYADISASIGQDPNIDVHCIPGTGNSCNAASPSTITVNLVRQKTEYLFGNPCNTQGLVLKQTLTGLVTLPPNNWTLQMTSSFRQQGIMNMYYSGNTPVTVLATLDNSSGLINNSPEFISDELPYQLYGSQYNLFTMQAIDIDGNSVSYEFITPHQSIARISCPQPVTGFTQPPHFKINTLNGALETVPFTPTQGFYTIAIQANEFRRSNGIWRKIGSIERDITYRTTGSLVNSNPQFTNLSRAGISLDFAHAIPVNPGKSVILTLTTADVDASQYRIVSANVPEAYNLSTPNIPQIRSLSGSQSELTWQVPPYIPAGRYVFSINVADNFCPAKGREIRPLIFEVTTRVLAAQQQSITSCLAAYPTPFREQVQFTLPKPGAQLITVFDGLGRAVAHLTSRPDGHVQWQPTAALAPGLYIARTADGQQQFRLLRE